MASSKSNNADDGICLKFDWWITRSQLSVTSMRHSPSDTTLWDDSLQYDPVSIFSNILEDSDNTALLTWNWAIWGVATCSLAEEVSSVFFNDLNCKIASFVDDSDGHWDSVEPPYDRQSGFIKIPSNSNSKKTWRCICSGWLWGRRERTEVIYLKKSDSSWKRNREWGIEPVQFDANFVG